MEVFRRAILQPGPPESFALQTVQQVIKPQKQTKLVQDENQLLENILRTLLQELVSGEQIMQYGQSIDDGDTTQGHIPRLLDIVLYLCENEHIEGGMIFQLLEDLTEMSTMRNCKDVFGYIESKQDILGKPELFARGKLVMLRTCNQLLRRLSKANDVVFCGRILMFLAHFFPLSERSAVNIKGVFNTSNETKYEKDPPDGISIDFNFYKTFWSLQEHFCNPPSLTLAPTKWKKFTSGLMVVLNTFEAQPLSDEEGDANSLEEEAANFSIKYLTSSKLMGLELKDPSFRRHILVQCLILFDYLKAPGKSEKDLPSDSMKEEIKSCEERVKKLLEMTPPKGENFLHKIEHILEREKNWVWWKRDGCPPFEKQPAEKKVVQEGAKKRFSVGNGEKIRFWEDLWLKEGILKDLFPRLSSLSRRKNQSIACFANNHEMPLNWDFDFRRNLSEAEIAEVVILLDILGKVRLYGSRSDRRSWEIEERGSFSCKSFRSFLLCTTRDVFPPFISIWKAKTPPKIQFFVWLAANGRINTCDCIQRRQPKMCLSPSWCVLCKENAENIDHLFIHCSYSLKLWWRMLGALRAEWVIPKGCFELLSINLRVSGKGKGKRAGILHDCLVHAIFGNIWMERNRRIFQGHIGVRVEELWDRIKFWASLWASVSGQFKDYHYSTIMRDMMAVLR
ncbi:THO complex subunit 1 isoform X2 [Prunus dulcis]|uniref:THO complex subunit 1 isoform X2 n=1 Tax=Prunus dulcis TaxID=3755 RepID=UPI001481F0FC|nr:THO complex subunit 1 isoform X2 [Prunus dulcis]